MEQRTRILKAAAELLSTSSEGDISTRAVCEAAGVGAPALYRQFGDKEGLLSAVVDYGFERYLASKRQAVPTSDPVKDLKTGWDNHIGFALENPNYYRLMWSPGLSAPPAAALEAHAMLRAVVERCASAGRLRVAVEMATQMIMSANAGVALSLISLPDIYRDVELSARVREAVIGAVTTATSRQAVGAEPDEALVVAVLTLQSLLDHAGARMLSGAERVLLREWLERLGDRSPPP